MGPNPWVDSETMKMVINLIERLAGVEEESYIYLASTNAIEVRHGDGYRVGWLRYKDDFWRFSPDVEED